MTIAFIILRVLWIVLRVTVRVVFASIAAFITLYVLAILMVSHSWEGPPR